MDEPARWLDRDRTANHICVRVYQLRRLVKSGKIPTPSYHLGPRLPRWDRLALDAAMGGSVAPTGSTNMALAVEALCNDIRSRPRRRAP